MISRLVLISFTIIVVICETISACGYDIRSHPPSVAQEQQSGEITAAFTTEGYTLRIVTNCRANGQQCPFRAEISAAPALFVLIEQVEYDFPTYSLKSPTTVTDASTRFRFEAEQNAREKVYAKVKLRRRDGAPPKVVQIEGTIPFAAEVTPPLRAGLRFEVNYRPAYLGGAPHKPVQYVFQIELRGEAAALKRVKSVEYRLPADEAKGARISRRLETEYYLEGTMPNKEGVVIIAVIRWKNGERSTHTIPLRPRQ